jgi:hypothetical protein
VPHPEGGELAVECPVAPDLAAAIEAAAAAFTAE